MIKVGYFFYPGASYETFLRTPHLLNNAFAYYPDFILVILTGNGFSEINVNADDFDQSNYFINLSEITLLILW